MNEKMDNVKHTPEPMTDSKAIDALVEKLEEDEAEAISGFYSGKDWERKMFPSPSIELNRRLTRKGLIKCDSGLTERLTPKGREAVAALRAAQQRDVV